MTDPRTRLPHALYRCHACGYLIPAVDIVATWQEREVTSTEQKGLCGCGSGRIQPANMSPDEMEKHLDPALLQRLLAGDTGPSTRIWRAALVEIRAGRITEATEDERQAALAYLPEFEPAPAATIKG